MRRYKLLATAFLILLSAHSTQASDWLVATQHFYLSQESLMQQRIEQKLRVALAGARSENRQIDSKGEQVVLGLIQIVEYQFLLDQMVCIEQTFALQDGRESIDDIELLNHVKAAESCAKERTNASEEMFQFASHYGRQFPQQWNACMAKNRLFLQELHYQPYPFMRLNNHHYEAFDSAGVVACMKASL